MPQDAKCPKCSHAFPVTEARHPFTVACPRCEAELTVEFKKPAAAPEAGQPPYELAVKPGALPGSSALPPKKRKSDDDDDDEPTRRGGSAMIVLLSGGLGLLFVLGGLGLTAWFLFTQIDMTETASNRPNNSANRGNNNSGNRGGNNNKPNGGNNNPNTPGIPSPPPKPKDTFELRPVKGPLPKITPPALPADPSNIDLDGKVGQVAVGGGGRYIVMHFPEKGQLGVFDMSTARINVTPADTGDMKLAAGLNRAVMYVPNSNIMRVYTLPDLRKLYDATSPMNGLRSIAMGSRTDGPMLGTGTFGDPVLMDVDANGIKEVEGARKGGLELHWNMLRASPDGTAFSTFDGFRPNQNTTVLVAENRQWRSRKDIGEVPFFGTDGNLYGNGVVMNRQGQDQNVGGIGRGSGTWFVPAVSGNGYFLKVAPLKQGKDAFAKKSLTLSIHANRNANTPVRGTTTFSSEPEFDGLLDQWGNHPAVMLDEHLFFSPDAKLLVVLNSKRDHLVLRNTASN